MINRFNQVSGWVSTAVIEIEDLKLRAVALNRFIFIAEKCRQLNNFNAVMEILSALNSSSLYRLRQTWDLLPQKTIQVFENLISLMDGDQNFLNYRQTLKKSTTPVVPYLGVYLTDLVFLDDGNEDLIPGTKLINFAKWYLSAGVIRDMQQYQMTPYCLENVEFIQSYLLNRPTLDEETLYQKSLEREQKIKKKRATAT